MSSPGVTHARQSEPLEWMVLGPLAPQEAQAYPSGYEQARRQLVGHLLSVKAASPAEDRKQTPGVTFVADNLELEETYDLIQERARGSELIDDAPEGRKPGPEDFCYASSFDRLTLKQPTTSARPAAVPMRVHVRNVLAVTAVLSVVALIYVAMAGGGPGLSRGVRTFLHDQVAKVRLILPRHDEGPSSATPPPVPAPSLNAARADQAPSTGEQSDERFLYSTASIAFTPLKLISPAAVSPAP